MKERTATRLAWMAFGLTVLLSAAALVLAILNQATQRGTAAQRDASTLGSSLFYLGLLSFAIVGVLIASRQPRNRIAWIFIAIALAWEGLWFGSTYVQYSLLTRPGALPFPDWVGALTTWLWAPAIVLMGTFLILLFPDGRLPSEKWRPLAWLSAFTLAINSLVDIFAPRTLINLGFGQIRNPIGFEVLHPILNILQWSVALIPLCMIGCAVSLISRFRRSRGTERLQMKWLATAGAIVAVGYPVFLLLNISSQSDPTPSLWISLVNYVGLLSFMLIPIAAGIAILKHRLYEIDVVINKALLFGALAAFITAVYVAIVVGVGALVGSGGKPNLALSIAATAIVAVAFQPVRERFQGLANRLVYGQRLTPYEVLRRFSRSLGALVSAEEVLPQIARYTAEGLGADRVSVTAYLEQGNETVVHPPNASPDTSGQRAAVTYRNEVVGEITAVPLGSEAFSGQQVKLLEQLAAQAGVVLHNYRLTVELRARLEELSVQDRELKESRERLVSAADTSRRTIEQAIRDGVEKRLVAIARDLGAAEAVLKDDPPAAGTVLEGLAQRTNETLEALRDLARGIYPPLLADKGLIVALEAHIRKVGLDVTLEVDRELAEERFDRSVETSCYFCVRETLDNVSRHAGGAHATVAIRRQDDQLVFIVTDEGPGFDMKSFRSRQGLQSMRDRIEASRGGLKIESAPGQGTTVTGWVPLTSSEPEAAPVQEALAAAQASSS